MTNPLPVKPCSDCGELSPDDAYGDIAVHDCETGEWMILTFTLPS